MAKITLSQFQLVAVNDASKRSHKINGWKV